jgi:hypothetical protein
MRRLALGSLAAAALVLTAAPAALAGPSDSSAVSTFQMVCDGELSTLTVGGGPWSAARVLETGRVFVPLATHLYLRDPDTLDVVYEEHDFKGAPRSGTSQCTEGFSTRSGLLGTFVVEGSMRP